VLSVSGGSPSCSRSSPTASPPLPACTSARKAASRDSWLSAERAITARALSIVPYFRNYGILSSTAGQLRFDVEIFPVATHRRCRHQLAAAEIAHGGIPRR